MRLKRFGHAFYFFIFLVATSFLSGKLYACPICHSDTGKKVRAGIFNDDFWSNFTAVTLPFVAFAMIGLVLYYGWPWEKARNAQTGSNWVETQD